jgi:hypothetical protein
MFAFASSSRPMIKFLCKLAERKRHRWCFADGWTRSAAFYMAAFVALSIAKAQESAPQTTPQRATAPTTEAADSTPEEPLSLELFYGFTVAKPVLRQGAADTTAQSGNLDFPGTSRYTPGIVASMPAGRGNAYASLTFKR